MKPKIVHLVVGYGFESYTINAVESVLSHTNDDNIILASTGGPFDRLLQAYSGNPRISLIQLQHRQAGKTGSLYHAYSAGLDIAQSLSACYLNIVQNDMQLLWWDDEILSRYLDIFESVDNCLFVQTGFVRFGSHPDIYDERLLPETTRSGHAFHVDRTNGWSDWGLFDLNRLKKYSITLDGYEHSLSARLRHLGFVTPYPNIPITAPIPWPATIRGSLILGKELEYKGTPFLAPRRADALHLLKTKRHDTLFQEDWIVSNNWWSLEPIWATDPNPEYITIRRQLDSSRRRPLRWVSNDRSSIFPSDDQPAQPSPQSISFMSQL
jgi:hypothetical protein